MPVPEAVVLTMGVFDAHIAPFAAEIDELTATFKAMQALTADTDNVWDVNVADAASAHVQHDSKRLEKQLQNLRAKIVAHSLDAAVLERVMVFVNQLPDDATLAVRSSASTEDTLTSAAAGQFVTALNVQRSPASVRRSTSSLFNLICRTCRSRMPSSSALRACSSSTC